MQDTELQRIVLVVDDSRQVCDAMRLVLEINGFTVIMASNGREALEILRDKRNNIKLIFSDLHMPGMDGLSMVEQLRQEGFKQAVIMLSTDGSATLVEKARALGANGWIKKPFEEAQVVGIARKLA